MFGTPSNADTNNLWCNILQQSFNQLCASNTSNMIFGSKIIKDNGRLAPMSTCEAQLGLIPTILPSSGDNSTTSVCPEVVNLSPPLITTIPPMSESSSLVASISSSSSFHTTVEDQTIIMTTPASYFPHSTPSSISSIINKQPQFTTGPMNMYSSALLTVTSSSGVTYTLPYSSSISFLATPTLIYASHTNHGVSQTSARSSLTSLGASPSPTKLFCSENDTWPMTPACANATSTDCRNNSSGANG